MDDFLSTEEAQKILQQTTVGSLTAGGQSSSYPESDTDAPSDRPEDLLGILDVSHCDLSRHVLSPSLVGEVGVIFDWLIWWKLVWFVASGFNIPCMTYKSKYWENGLKYKQMHKTTTTQNSSRGPKK